ncbi:hypothetical protein KSP39_PZI024030 [Platanthera zijinensis]|uniref:Uncharacterized protein n=1 Tax=Platanthera zijinensis TaxID=2320716 RepID=A0AAP0FU41_9ASPA
MSISLDRPNTAAGQNRLHLIPPVAAAWLFFRTAKPHEELLEPPLESRPAAAAVPPEVGKGGCRPPGATAAQPAAEMSPARCRSDWIARTPPPLATAVVGA